MIEYMKRLITPRSQRRIIGTVLPSIVVVCSIDAGRRRRGRVVVEELPGEVAVDEADDRRRLARRRLRDRRQPDPRPTLPGARAEERRLVRAGEDRALQRVVRQRHARRSACSPSPAPAWLAASVLSPSGRPVTTPSSWWFPSGSGPKAEVTSAPFSVTSTSPSARRGRDGDLDPRVAARDVRCRARDDGDVQCVRLGRGFVARGRRGRRGGERGVARRPARSVRFMSLPFPCARCAGTTISLRGNPGQAATEISTPEFLLNFT